MHNISTELISKFLFTWEVSNSLIKIFDYIRVACTHYINDELITLLNRHNN